MIYRQNGTMTHTKKPKVSTEHIYFCRNQSNYSIFHDIFHGIIYFSFHQMTKCMTLHSTLVVIWRNYQQMMTRALKCRIVAVTAQSSYPINAHLMARMCRIMMVCSFVIVSAHPVERYTFIICNVLSRTDEADNLNPIEKNIVAENEVPRPNPIQCLDKTDGFNKILVVDMGKRIRATTDNSPINQPLPTKAIPIRVNHRVPYDRNVQLAPRPHNGVEPTVRQSNRKVTPLKHFNYGTVKCSICGRKFFCEAMSTEHYDGRIACSIACYTRAN